MKNLFKKKYRIKVTKLGKYKRYYPQIGRLFYSKFSLPLTRVGKRYVYFTSEDLARMYINDRLVEDEKEVTVDIIKVK